MDKLKNRLLSGLLAFTMILTGMPGLSGIMVANAAEEEAKVTEITCNVTNICADGGEIEVTIKGENLDGKAYYDIWGIYSMFGKELSKRLSKDAKSAELSKVGDAWMFKVVLPAKASAADNTYGEPIGFKIGVSGQSGGVANMNSRVDSDKITIGNGEAPTPSVDKSELNNAISTAEKLKKADYTTATWTPFAKALAAAKDAQAKKDATQEEVNKAKTDLKTAQANLRGLDVEAVCTGVKVNPTKVGEKGGEVEVIVEGTDLMEDAYYQVYYNYDLQPGKPTDASFGTKNAVKMTKAGNAWKFKATIPAVSEVPDTCTVNGFKIGVRVNGINSSLTKSGLISIANAAGPAEVTSITATPNKLSFKGGEVTINAQGINLTADNWGFDATAYISDTDMEKKVSWAVKEQTADHVTLIIPKNAMANDLEYRVTAGAKKDDNSFDKQATTTFMIEQKPYLSDGTFNAESAQLIADNKVQVNFEKEYEIYCKGDEAAGLFSILDAKGDNLNYKATAVSFEGKSAVVTFESKVPKEAASVGFDEGIFLLGEKNGKPYVNAANSIILKRGSTISSITFNNEVLDNKGGIVKATLDGYGVDAINLKSISAKVFAAGNATATDIDVKTEFVDGKIVLSYDLPENKTDLTQSYILKVYHDSKEVIIGASRESRNVISVLPAGKTAQDQTLGMATIVAMRNTGNTDLQNAVAEVSKSIGELKTEVRLYGTNLDMTKTKLRAIDENGIEWPVYDIPECDGMWRFVAIAGTHKNGVFGDGNSQLVELLPPRYAGTNKKYTIQVSIDGEHWLNTNTVTLTVNNEGVSGESDFRTCNKEDIKTIAVKYVDESGKEIAKTDEYKCYDISMFRQFPIAPKEIEGYTLIKEKNPTVPGNDKWVYQGSKNYTYTYKSNSTGEETPAPTPGGGGAAPSTPAPSKDPITNNKDNSGNVSTDVNLGDKVTTENGKADVKLDKDLADKVVENATNNKSESVNLNAGTTTGNTTKTELTLLTDAYKDIAGKTDAKKITVKTDSATVSMDKETVVAIAEQAGSAEEVKLVVETKESADDKVVIELKLVTSNGEIHDFKGGKVTVTVPVKNTSGKKLVAVYIDNNGKYTKVGGELTADGKAFVFETGHFSTYAVMTEEAADAAIKAQEPEQPAKPVVKSVAITSVKAQKKAMKVTWKKSADKVNGYQVRYSTSKSFKASKTLSVKYTKKVNSKTVKNLKSGKRYYVKVRAYVKNADGTYYSKWSKVKSVKVK